MSWDTDTEDFSKAIKEFEKAHPGFWWSVGQCSVGAHASCGVDSRGVQSELLDGVVAGHPFDAGFHVDTTGGSPADALRQLTQEVTTFMRQNDLVKRLRIKGKEPYEIYDQPLRRMERERIEAADRIEELEADYNKLAAQSYYREIDLGKAEGRIKVLEAKLEKAVEAFTRIDDLTCHNMPMTAREEQAVNREVRAALAQLKGQDDGNS